MSDPKFRVRMSVTGDTAEIRVGSEIGDSWWGDSITANAFADQVAQLGPVSKINLVVNSPGGDVFDAAAMTETLKRNAASVNVIVDGLMASAATFFLDAADDVSMGTNSVMVIHDAWSGVMGNAADMRKQADILDKLSGQIAELYARRAGGTADAWRDLMLEETWFTAQEAVDAGLADSVAQELTAAPEQLAAAALVGRPAAHDPLRIVAQLRDKTSQPVRVEITPTTSASIKKETVVVEAAKTEELDGNAIEALMKFQGELDSKINAVSDKAYQKFLDAMEPVPTVTEVRDAVIAEAKMKSGPGYWEVLNAIGSRRKGSASEKQLELLSNALGSSKETVFQNAFTYGSGGTALQEQQFIGELVAKVAYSPVIWDLIGHDDLVGPTVYGGAATTLPAGGDYAGNGGVVSSTAPVWAQESLTALLYALAAGLPRINFDFGQEAALLNSFFRYALSDYYKWRDTKTVTKILGTSTGFFGALSTLTATKAPSNSIIQDAVNKLAYGIVNVATQQGGQANFGLITTADFTSLLQASQQQAPAFWNVNLGALTEGNAEGKFSIRLDATGTLTTGQTLVGNGLNGITGYELAGDGPVRVEQVVTATGTVDTGMFGYVAPFRENANYFALVTAVSTT